MKERGAFQTQHSPGAPAMGSSSRYLFVALFWSSPRPELHRSRRYIKASGQTECSQVGWYASKRSLAQKKAPPSQKRFPNTTTQRLKAFEVTCDHARKRARKRSHRNVKTNSSGLAASLSASFIRGRSEKGGRRREKKSPQTQLE